MLANLGTPDKRSGHTPLVQQSLRHLCRTCCNGDVLPTLPTDCHAAQHALWRRHWWPRKPRRRRPHHVPRRGSRNSRLLGSKKKSLLSKAHICSLELGCDRACALSSAFCANHSARPSDTDGVLAGEAPAMFGAHSIFAHTACDPCLSPTEFYAADGRIRRDA